MALLLTAAALPARAQPRLVDRGRALFSGEAPFTHGGPACAGCHDSAALPRPGGGTMGPDLTNVAVRMGPQGVAASLDTLYFPTMAPLFAAHPLVLDERQALAAFLEGTAAITPRPAAGTIALGAAAAVGGVVLFAITALAGRSRIRSVRLALLARRAAPRRAEP